MLARYPDAKTARDAFRMSGDLEGLRFHCIEKDATGRDLIHVDAARGLLRTARGATAPLREARAAFTFIAAKRAAKALPWEAKGMAGTSAGGFALASIARDGAATFGCHVFAWAEMERAAKRADELSAERNAERV